MPINLLVPPPLTEYQQLAADHPSLVAVTTTGARIATYLGAWDVDTLALLESLSWTVWRVLDCIHEALRPILHIEGILPLAALAGSWRALWLVTIRQPTPNAGARILTLTDPGAALLDAIRQQIEDDRTRLASAWLIDLGRLVNCLRESGG